MAIQRLPFPSLEIVRPPSLSLARDRAEGLDPPPSAHLALATGRHRPSYLRSPSTVGAMGTCEARRWVASRPAMVGAAVGME